MSSTDGPMPSTSVGIQASDSVDLPCPREGSICVDPIKVKEQKGVR